VSDYTFKEYQEDTKEFAVYPTLAIVEKWEVTEEVSDITFGESLGWIYPMFGLAGEVGELAEKLKKALRDSFGEIDHIRDDLKKEIGDIFWYISQMATELGFDLEEIAKMNISKLSDRKARDKISGSGDNR